MEQLKSRERVRDQGEVFTRPQEVGKMLRMVDDKVRDISATFLEPAVGQGIFLQKILRKRLEYIVEEFPIPPNEKSKINRKFLQALFTLYGVDICPDNVEETKTNLFYEFKLSYPIQIKGEGSSVLKKAKEILDYNIIHGNTLEYINLQTGEDLKFQEWEFKKCYLTKQEFSFKQLIDGQTELF